MPSERLSIPKRGVEEKLETRLRQRRERLNELLNNPWYAFAALRFLFEQENSEAIIENLNRVENELNTLESEEAGKGFDFKKFKETLKALVSFLENILGESWGNFKLKSANDNPFEESQTEKQNIKNRLYEVLDFLEDEAEDPERTLDQLAQKANKIIKGDVGTFFVGSTLMQMTENVEQENDLVELLYLAKHPRAGIDVPFEVFRKILLILFLGKNEQYLRNKYSEDGEDGEDLSINHEDNRRANTNMVSFIEKYFVDPSSKLGEPSKEYLQFRFTDDSEKKVKEASISGDKPTQNSGPENLYYVPIPMRNIILEDAGGEPYKTQMYFHGRKKEDESSLSKQIRFGREIGERVDDQNGFHFVFKTTKDARNFFRMLNEKIPQQILQRIKERITFLEKRIAFLKAKNEGINTRTLASLGRESNETMIQAHDREIQRLRERLDALEKDIEKSVVDFMSDDGRTYESASHAINDIKDSLPGSLNPEAGSITSSKVASEPKEWLKGKLVIKGVEHTWQLEVQTLTPSGRANLEYGRGESPAEHHVGRFFSPNNFPKGQPFNLENGEASLLFPEFIYGDPKELKNRALMRAARNTRDRLSVILPQKGKKSTQLGFNFE